MTITYYNELSLFHQAIDAERNILQVTYKPSTSPSASEEEEGENEEVGTRCVEIALEPATDGLKTISVDMHGSPTQAYVMDEETNRFFSDCLGYEIILTCLGPHRRKVLGNIAPGNTTSTSTSTVDSDVSTQSWLGSMVRGLPSLMGMAAAAAAAAAKGDEVDEGTITFADIAPYLVVTQESLDDVSRRLQDGLEMDVTKFRPNIVVEGAEQAWDEDYWGGITITAAGEGGGEQSELVLTSNCARCVSVNVDYSTGRPATGDEGSVLKKMMRDRRVDAGTKWSPIFGRYGFLKGGERGVKIGDEVLVSKRNSDRTVFRKSDFTSQQAEPSDKPLIENRMAWNG